MLPAPTPAMLFRPILVVLLFSLSSRLHLSLPAATPIPDKLVVLTFDDSSASHATVAAPLLKRYGFGATFFITEGFTFKTNKRDYLTWAQIAELHRAGFEIGNHTRDHLSITEKNVPKLAEQLAAYRPQLTAALSSAVAGAPPTTQQ